eukprot:TRINITY_DN3345_c0_g1_i1.p1 TRINITY_DN3345_c0_g1~~TRINITY_DN3345_c0_g1_i1.p1  ORF type:complete len:304 (-),score=0.13 TRINITY_DN3345_c0_g1_i1:622-1533(-)
MSKSQPSIYKASAASYLGELNSYDVLTCCQASTRSRKSRRTESRLLKVKHQRQLQLEGNKLTVSFLADHGVTRDRWGCRRFYTLTHNDLSGDLHLSIGHRYNLEQLQGPWQRILRDEVLAWWEFMPSPQTQNGHKLVKKRPILHVQCHVSGEQKWPLPLQIRDYIFQLEIPLVLKSILKGDCEFLQQRQQVQNSIVVVHLQSDWMILDRQLVWGLLGDPDTWRQPPPFVDLIASTALDSPLLQSYESYSDFYQCDDNFSSVSQHGGQAEDERNKAYLQSEQNGFLTEQQRIYSLPQNSTQSKQ